MALDRAPVDIGCDAVGWPEDLEPFSSLTFQIDPAAVTPVIAVSDTGVELSTWWVPGFEPAAVPEPAVLGPGGEIVARDGDVLALVPWGDGLEGYPICVTTKTLIVMLKHPSG